MLKDETIFMKLYAHIYIFKILSFNVTYSPVTGTFIFLFGQLETVRPKKTPML